MRKDQISPQREGNRCAEVIPSRGRGFSQACWQKKAVDPEERDLIQGEGKVYGISVFISSKLKQEYAITPQLLLGTSISEIKRAVLRFWIYEEATKLKLDRIAVSTANYLVDMYFSRGGLIQMQDFQALGLAALLLSNKTWSSETNLLIDQSLFPSSLINALQLKICKISNFRLTPITYVHILDELIGLWNIFAERHSDLWKYNCQSEMSSESAKIFCSKKIYQLLDTIFLVVKSFSYSLLDICLHVFKYFLLLDYQFVANLPKSIEDEVIINFWCNPEDVSLAQLKQPLMGSSFPAIFFSYLEFIGQICKEASTLHERFNYNVQVEHYVQSFMQAGFSKTFTRSLTSQIQASKQTFNPSSLQISKTFMIFKKNKRKESGETLSL